MKHTPNSPGVATGPRRAVEQRAHARVIHQDESPTTPHARHVSASKIKTASSEPHVGHRGLRLNALLHSVASPTMKRNLASVVHEYLDGDIAAREILARGALGLRQMARWLMKTQAWPGATEVAIVSAIRRYPIEGRSRAAALARHMLHKSHVNTRANICSIMLPKTTEAHRALVPLVQCIDPSRGEMVRIIEGERAIKVIVDRVKLDQVCKVLGDRNINYDLRDLVEYSLVCPDEAGKTPGILALVFSSLAAHDVNVIEAVGGSGEQLIFVHERDARLTFQILQKITRGGRTSRG